MHGYHPRTLRAPACCRACAGFAPSGALGYREKKNASRNCCFPANIPRCWRGMKALSFCLILLPETRILHVSGHGSPQSTNPCAMSTANRRTPWQ